MRQRITYIRQHDDSFHPRQLVVSNNAMSVESLLAAKELRLTIGFSELSRELITVLDQCHELHIRWSSPKSYNAVAPFVSRVASGLHVFYTPEEGVKYDFLCPLLKQVFDEHLKCSSPATSFSSPAVLSTRFASSASSQFYSYLPSLDNLVQYLQQKICRPSQSACQEGATSLRSANYLDIDYDAISHALLITAFWETSPDDGAWNEKIENLAGDRIEVGVLNAEKAEEKEEMRLGGWLTVVGEDDKPKPTLFSFPSRHHPLLKTTDQQSFITTVDHPSGLHPILRISFRFENTTHLLSPPFPSCTLHAYLTLPSVLFLDRHAFTDPLILSMHNLVSLRTLSGATDLEAPEWAVPQWGFAALLELAVAPPINESTSPSGGEAETYDVTIPLHLRYLTPSINTSYTDLTIPYPTLFWACMAEEGAAGSAKMAVNPFDRTNLGYDGLFGDRTFFYHLTPVSAGHDDLDSMTMRIEVPVLDLRRSEWVEVGTVSVVVVGMLWIIWKLFGPLGKKGKGVEDRGTAQLKEEGKKVR